MLEYGDDLTRHEDPIAATAAGLVKHTGTDQLVDVELCGTVRHVEHSRRPWDGDNRGCKQFVDESQQQRRGACRLQAIAVGLAQIKEALGSIPGILGLATNSSEGMTLAD